MAFTAIEAAQLLDQKKLSESQIELMIGMRQGVLKSKLDEDEDKQDDLQALSDYGFLTVVPLSHPRVLISVPAYAPSEEGVTILNEIDRRYKEHSLQARPYANAPQGLKEEILRTPTDKELPIMAAKSEDGKIEKDPKKAVREAREQEAKDVAKAGSDSKTENKKK